MPATNRTGKVLLEQDVQEAAVRVPSEGGDNPNTLQCSNQAGIKKPAPEGGQRVLAESAHKRLWGSALRLLWPLERSFQCSSGVADT